MSCHVLQRLQAEGALDPRTFADLCHLAPHSAYPYFSERELHYSKLRALMRGGDPRVVQALLDDLLPPGWCATHLPAELDIDGDGDVDTDDVLKRTSHSMQALAELIESIADSGDGRPITADELTHLRAQCSDVIQLISAASQTVQHIYDHQPTRRPAKNGHRYRQPASNGKGGPA